jgi:hypothetical protein
MVQAVCAFVHDIGTQVGEYKGKPNIAHKVIVTWELTEKMTKGEYEGKPFMMSKYYTLSLNEKANLRHDLESWRGKGFTDEELEGFDVEKLVGANCFLNLVKNDKDKVVISAITQLPKNTSRITPITTEPFEKFMEWINRERAKSLEMTQPKPANHTVAQEESSNPEESDLPF